MSSIKLYHFPLSAPSRGALLAAKLVGVPVEVVIIDLLKKEQLSESFLKINPQHCVPTLDDNGFVLWESRAIACYLADKYGKDDKLYPKDLKQRAIVNQRLYYDSSFLYPRIRNICYPILFGGVTEIQKPLKDELNVSLGFLNQFLSDSIWVAGDNMTIADTAILASLSSILIWRRANTLLDVKPYLLLLNTYTAVGWDLSDFPDIQRWYKQCTEVPGYEENLEGAKLFGGAVKKNLK